MAITSVVVALALVAAARADVMDRETYDDVPGDVELMYPEQNYVDLSEPDPEPVSSEPRTGPTTQPRKYNDHTRRILLYKMMMALRNYDASPSLLSVPKWIPSGTVLVPPDTLSYSHLKGPQSMFKRSPDEASKPPRATRPLQKWKIKKGKSGPPMICYFKLCSFRSS